MNDDGSASAVLFKQHNITLVDAGIPLLDVFVAMCATRLDANVVGPKTVKRGVEAWSVSSSRKLKRRRNRRCKRTHRVWLERKQRLRRPATNRFLRHQWRQVGSGRRRRGYKARPKATEEVSVVMRKAMKKRLAKLASTTRNM